MNSDRILQLGDNKFRFHDAGSYADLFVNTDRSRCWKVFRKLPESMRSFDIFESELAAYKIAANSTYIRKLVPQLYRSRIASIGVLDINGQSVTSEYFKELNFELEFINKPFQKLGSLPWDDVCNLREIFLKEGIKHLSDASITADVDSPKIIDFAVQEFEIDVGPLAPAFIQRVLLLNTSSFPVWRARRARSLSVAQAPGARTPVNVR